MRPSATSVDQPFRLDPNAYEPTARRRMWRRSTLMMLLVLIFLEIADRALGVPEGLSDHVWITPEVLLLTAFSLFRVLRKQLEDGKPSWNSYSLTVGDDLIRREMSNVPSLEIRRADVTHIHEVRGAGITVLTADRHRFVFIPEQLIGYESVRGLLAEWKPFEPPKLARSWLVSAAWSIALIGSCLGTAVIHDIRLAMGCGAVLWAVGALLIREIRRLEMLDDKTKATYIGGVCLMLLSPVTRLLLSYAAPQ